MIPTYIFGEIENSDLTKLQAVFMLKLISEGMGAARDSARSELLDEMRQMRESFGRVVLEAVAATEEKIFARLQAQQEAAERKKQARREKLAETKRRKALAAQQEAVKAESLNGEVKQEGSSGLPRTGKEEEAVSAQARTGREEEAAKGGSLNGEGQEAVKAGYDLFDQRGQMGAGVMRGVDQVAKEDIQAAVKAGGLNGEVKQAADVDVHICEEVRGIASAAESKLAKAADSEEAARTAELMAKWEREKDRVVNPSKNSPMGKVLSLGEALISSLEAGLVGEQEAVSGLPRTGK